MDPAPNQDHHQPLPPGPLDRRHRMPRRSLLRMLAGGLFLTLTQGCITAPIVLDGGTGRLEVTDFPAGTELVEIEVEPEVLLRGVYVPAGPGAPVVLHLLRSSGSVTYGAQHRSLAELARRGFSSLMVDYRGVGRSGGRRSSAHLESDARACWEEALRRAGGDPDRVHLRGTSLGALAVATLLEDGVRPAAVSLVVPVRAETMLDNYLSDKLPAPVAWLVRRPFRNPVEVDIVSVLRGTEVPLLVHTAEGDYYLPGEERVWMQEAVTAAGGRWISLEGSHLEVGLMAQGLFPAERSLYQQEPRETVASVATASPEMVGSSGG